jgi:F420-dependent oxidoreductase-like protein
MKLGITIANLTYPGGAQTLGRDLRDIVTRAEAAGVYSIWVMDHFFQIEHIGPHTMDMLEGYSLLSYFAGITGRVKLGTMVTGVTYRYPGVLAKIATTLDVISGGRSYLGIGAAWFEREHKALGVPFPSTSERFERLEECLQICQQMWSDNNGPYQGKHYQLAETLCVPQPVSKPHPPILIGGMGEKKTLRLVAQYAQGCNLFQFAGVPTLKHKLAVLKEHCQELGRDYEAIVKTVLGRFNPEEPNQYLESLHEMAELGFTHALTGIPNPTDPKGLEVLATEIIPKLDKLAAA